MIRIAIAALGAVLLTSTAVAQPPPSATSDEVVVTGIRPAQIRSLVRQLAEPGKQDQLSRWDGRVCAGVVGVRTAAAQALIDRIAMRALSIGLESGRPGCRANVLVIVTPDAAAFTPSFVDQNKRFFSYNEDSGNALGRDALAAFASSGRPVRWWHVSQTVTDHGQVLGQSDATQGASSGGEGGDFKNAQVARVTNSGRLRGGTRQEFKRVIVIVDSGAIAGKPFTAVADYIAMISLAQLRPNVEHAGVDTILNLFDAGEGGPTGWTTWDQAYLEGLYAAPAFARTATQQQNVIARRIEDATGNSGAPPAEAEPPAPLPVATPH